jgi:hypothetical protein
MIYVTTAYPDDKHGQVKTELGIDWKDDSEALVESALVIQYLVRRGQDFPEIACKAAILSETENIHIVDAIQSALIELEKKHDGKSEERRLLS